MGFISLPDADEAFTVHQMYPRPSFAVEGRQRHAPCATRSLCQPDRRRQTGVRDRLSTRSARLSHAVTRAASLYRIHLETELAAPDAWRPEDPAAARKSLLA